MPAQSPRSQAVTNPEAAGPGLSGRLPHALTIDAVMRIPAAASTARALPSLPPPVRRTRPLNHTAWARPDQPPERGGFHPRVDDESVGGTVAWPCGPG